MATTFNHTISAGGRETNLSASPLTRFFIWAEKQEEQRLLWLGLGLGLQGCVITPLAFMVTVMSGVNMFLLAMVMLSIVSVLVVNLAALPTRITIPVFFASLALDLAVIVTCAASGFSIY